MHKRQGSCPAELAGRAPDPGPAGALAAGETVLEAGGVAAALAGPVTGAAGVVGAGGALATAADPDDLCPAGPGLPSEANIRAKRSAAPTISIPPATELTITVP